MQGRNSNSDKSRIGIVGTALLRILLGCNLMSIIMLWAVAACQYVSPQTSSIAGVLCMTLPAVVALNLLFIPFWLIVHLRFVPIPMLGIALCFGSLHSYCPMFNGSADTTGCMKVMTYNVHSFGIKADDRPLSKEWIRDQNADLLILQEVYQPAHLDDFKEWGYNVCNKRSLAVLTHYQVIDCDQLDIPTRDCNQAMWAKLLCDGDTLMVVNLHLESFKLDDADRETYSDVLMNPTSTENDEQRRTLLGKLRPTLAMHGEQIDVVREFVENSLAAGHRVIVGGDFNDVPGSYAVAQMRSLLTDGYRTAGSGPGFTFSENMLHFRIDHLFCSPHYEPKAAVVDKSNTYSDHYPLLMWL